MSINNIKSLLSLNVYDVAPVYSSSCFLYAGTLCVCPRWVSKPTETQDVEELIVHLNNCGLTAFMLFQLPLGEPVLVYVS